MPKEKTTDHKFGWMPPDKLVFYDENGKQVETVETSKPPPPQPAD